VRAVAGAAAAQAAFRALDSWPPGGAARWTRVNHRGNPVSLLAGPALAVASTLTTRVPGRAAVVAGLGVGAIGAYDDLIGGGHARGFRGHVAALRAGTVTTGIAKVAGIGTAGLLAASSLRRRPGDVLLDAAIVAGTANLLNLLDLRPGRALKVGLLLATATREPGVAGACAALLPDDLGERTMLGDTGANALGAVLGVAVADRLAGRRARVAVLSLLAGLTAASEVVSFSSVIDRTPPLRALDQLGRRP
jgi:UDP-N-acetylmuramyl pentapeptide phosphotransferase/UDP-N-acetylglucosamine-1-phosphate transferase